MNTITLKIDDIPNETLSKPEVFIIEILPKDDVDNGRLDGEILYSQLRLIGRNPRYIRINDQNEFAAALVIFRQSNYRFLHISCHGTEDAVLLGTDRCDFSDFAQLTKDMLKSRRVSFSACKLGNQRIAEALFAANPGMHSFLAPIDNIEFGTASVFWSAFFTLVYKDCEKRNEQNVSQQLILEMTKAIGSALSVKMLLAQANPKKKMISFFESDNENGTMTDSIPLPHIAATTSKGAKQ